MRRLRLVTPLLLILLWPVGLAGCGACIPDPVADDGAPYRLGPAGPGAPDGGDWPPPGRIVREREGHLEPGAPGFCWTQLHLRKDRVGADVRRLPGER